MPLKKVITYGTFDLLHQGHINILKRARALGDYLIVGVTSDTYDRERGKLNVQDTLHKRIENIKNTGFADEVIVEEYEGQKIADIAKYDVDIFAIGSDWEGKFDYLDEYCKVVYLERTKGISSTQIRTNHRTIGLGIIGNGRIAKRFLHESKYVSGMNVEGVLNPNIVSAKKFCEEGQLNFYTNSPDEFFSKVDAVYIATPHESHFQYMMLALRAGKHVLCEKPLVLEQGQAVEAFDFAHKNKLILMEAIKTAYCPAFQHMLLLARSGRIGKIIDIEASFTKIVSDSESRELSNKEFGGSMTELASYPLLPIVKLLGGNFNYANFYSLRANNGVDLYTKGLIKYNNAIASFKVGLGAKTEGDLVVTGTRGYLYVPSPWWKTEYFEMRFEDQNENRKYFYRFEGDGLRYEITDFIKSINQGKQQRVLCADDSIQISKIIDLYRQRKQVDEIK